MPAPALPADPAGGPPTCTPETLYTYVVGRPPGPELGYPAERGDMHGDVGGGSFLQDEHPAMPEQADVDRDNGASARAKKRRKVQRRSKVSEIWFPRAEMAFCTCVTAIPPNGRTKIKFFGRPLGRNELIAAICTLATRRLYNRKQISSHSQVLKDKVPLQFKEIFTFEDKSRGSDEPAESSTANVIETYQFPDIIYSIIDYPLGTDLANAPKPGWLVELEAGGNDSQAPQMDPSTPRGYNPTYWSNSPQQSSGYPSYYDRSGGGGGGGGAYPKGKDRESRPIGGDPYYQYSPPGALRQSNAPYPPPSHSLPPLGLPRDIDSTGAGDNGRYGYSQGTSRARMGNGGWDDHARSPTSTSSYDAPQSQGSAGMSPRQTTGQWQDVKPNISNAELTLPPLQEVPSPSSYDWKDRSPLYPDAKWGGAPQSTTSAQSAMRSGLPGLPSFGLVASQSYPSSGNAGGWSEPSPYWDSTSSLRTDRNSLISRIPPFQPCSLDFTADARTSSLSLTASEALVNGPPMALDTVLVTRYPFLAQISQSSGVTVYHLDVPLTIPPTDPARDLLLDSISDIGIELGLQSPGGDLTGWAVTTDSLWLSTAGPNRQPRVMTPLRASGAAGELTCKIQLPRLGHLYNMLLQNMRVNFYYNASLGDIGLPNTDIVQRIVRESTEPRATVDPSLMPDMGSDWSSATAVLIWTLRVTDGSQPTVITVRQIDFDARYEPLSDQHIASHILGSEEQKPSTFNWM